MSNHVKHVAIIMDGNGRHGTKKFSDRVSGHSEGAKTAKNIILHAKKCGIPFLSLWAFSKSNWKREKREIDGIFNLINKFSAEKKFFNANNIRVVFLGFTDDRRIPLWVRKGLWDTERLTKSNTGITVAIQLNYDGKSDTVQAIQTIAQRVQDGDLDVKDITDDLIKKNTMYGLKGIPDPDVVIRTGGRLRMSSYAMLNIAESEILFYQELWPDFTPKLFDIALKHFESTPRTLGGTK